MNDAKFKELLAQRATQFRVIQRRLLARFKDKTPSPLNNLDTLLDGTYRQVGRQAQDMYISSATVILLKISLE